MSLNHSIGLFFGSFNPIHNGHIKIARYILDHKFCDELWFVVSPQNPMKDESSLLSEEFRYELVKTAIQDIPNMEACDIEFSLPKPSYTINTLNELEQHYPDVTFMPIMGSDNLEIFKRWKAYDEICRRFKILVYPRKSSEKAELLPNMTMVDAPLFPVSSTDVRRRIKEGESIDGLVPASIQGRVKILY